MISARHGERGSSMVEFVLAVAVTMTLLFGALEFGRALFDYDMVANAAKEGARYLIVNGNTSCACTLTEAQAGTNISTYLSSVDATTSGITYSVTFANSGTCTTANAAIGCLVEVTANYTFSSLAFPGLNGIHFSSTSEMNIAQ